MRAALALALSAMAAPALAAGPSDWAGTWTGDCVLTPPREGIERFAASLTIGATDDPGRLRWMLVYETGERDVRRYELVTVDAAAGRYVVDEKNGLKLEAGFADGVLYAPFTIGEALIVASYRVGADGAMHADMPSFSNEALAPTCLEANPETCTRSFALQGTQHCTLKKQALRKLD